LRRTKITTEHGERDQRPPPFLEERADEDHDLGRQRERLAGLRERLLELRHDVDQQDHHRRDGDADQDDRVDQRALDGLAELLVALHRVGEAREHGGERAARLARAHDVDVETVEHLAPRVERLRHRLAAAHLVADALQERRGERRRRQPDQRLERAVERQPGAQQRRELARERHQLVLGESLLREQAARRARLAARRRGHRARRGRHDLHRHEPLVAQAVEDLALVRGVELAHRHRAARGDRLVAVKRHPRPP
jgi:hypothetical protein